MLIHKLNLAVIYIDYYPDDHKANVGRTMLMRYDARQDEHHVGARSAAAARNRHGVTRESRIYPLLPGDLGYNQQGAYERGLLEHYDERLVAGAGRGDWEDLTGLTRRGQVLKPAPLYLVGRIYFAENHDVNYDIPVGGPSYVIVEAITDMDIKYNQQASSTKTGWATNALLKEYRLRYDIWRIDARYLTPCGSTAAALAQRLCGELADAGVKVINAQAGDSLVTINEDLVMPPTANSIYRHYGGPYLPSQDQLLLYAPPPAADNPPAKPLTAKQQEQDELAVEFLGLDQ